MQKESSDEEELEAGGMPDDASSHKAQDVRDCSLDFLW